MFLVKTSAGPSVYSPSDSSSFNFASVIKMFGFVGSITLSAQHRAPSLSRGVSTATAWED